MKGTALRIVTWNMRRAVSDSAAWNYLESLRPDVALLQEVGGIPPRLQTKFDVLERRPRTKDGNDQRFSSAVLVLGEICDRDLEVAPAEEWARRELQALGGAVIGCSARVREEFLGLVCVHSPAWPVPRDRLRGIDTEPVKLTQNQDVWCADLLLAGLREMDLEHGRLVIAGDFNLSETFDAWRGGPRGNREYLDRMQTLGLEDCLREHQGRLVPTFRNPRGGDIKHQIDHLFANENARQALVECSTGTHADVFDLGLSDHLPIIADFSFPFPFS